MAQVARLHRVSNCAGTSGPVVECCLAHGCIPVGELGQTVQGCLQGLMAQLNQGNDAEEVGGNAWRELCGVRRVQWEKFLKTKLEDAIRLFNDDYRKGFQMMQARLS
jgi:hypothetical protein